MSRGTAVLAEPPVELQHDGASPDDVPPSRRSWAARHRTALVYGARLLIVVATLTVWELFTRPNGVSVGSWSHAWDPAFVGSPSTIMSSLQDWLDSGTLWSDLYVTLKEAFMGFAFGCAAGFIIGVTLGRMVFLSEVLDPFIVALYSLPKIALAPLLILWFGIGLTPKVVLVTIIVFFLVFYATLTGTRSVDRDVIDAIRLLGGRRRHVLFKAQIPAAMSHVFLGLKLSIPYALLAAIIGEFMVSNQGIGSHIQQRAGQFDTAGVFAGLFVLMLVASALNSLLGALQGRLLRWSEVGGERA